MVSLRGSDRTLEPEGVTGSYGYGHVVADERDGFVKNDKYLASWGG